MFKIDNANVVTVKPAKSAAGTQGYFSKTGVATTVDADFLNSIQDEITEVISYAGLTNSKADDTQLRQAIRIIADTAGTPAQFDNSTKVATTAFNKRMGVQLSNVTPFTGALTGVVGHVGGMVYGYSTSLNSYSVPDSTTYGLPVGSTIKIANLGSQAITVARQGSDTFQHSDGSVVSSSFSVPAGTEINVDLVAVGTWFIHGTGDLAYSSQFGSSLGLNGYQKLPSGMIIQWGHTPNFTNDATFYDTYFPLTFPNACLSVTLTDNADHLATAVPKIRLIAQQYFEASQTQVYGTSTSHSYWYIAVGY